MQDLCLTPVCAGTRCEFRLSPTQTLPHFPGLRAHVRQAGSAELGVDTAAMATSRRNTGGSGAQTLRKSDRVTAAWELKLAARAGSSSAAVGAWDLGAPSPWGGHLGLGQLGAAGQHLLKSLWAECL